MMKTMKVGEIKCAAFNPTGRVADANIRGLKDNIKYSQVFLCGDHDPYSWVTIRVVWHGIPVMATGYSIRNTVDEWDCNAGFKKARRRAIADAARQIVQLDWHETQAKKAEERRLADAESACIRLQKMRAEECRVTEIVAAKARVDAMRASDAMYPEKAAAECGVLEGGAAKALAEKAIDAMCAAELGMCTEQLPGADDAEPVDMTARLSGSTEPSREASVSSAEPLSRTLAEVSPKSPAEMQAAGMVASPFSPDDPLVAIEAALERVVAGVDRLALAVKKLEGKLEP